MGYQEVADNDGSRFTILPNEEQKDDVPQRPSAVSHHSTVSINSDV